MAVSIQFLDSTEDKTAAPLQIDKTTVLLGRGSDQDVRLSHSSVSRRHCVIEKREGEWWLIDEDSHNGTLVNGQRVRNRRKVHHEDVLQVGEVMLRIGLDRPLRPESKRTAQANLPLLVRGIMGTVLLFVIAFGAIAAWLVLGYQQRVHDFTRPLPVALGAEQALDIFPDSDFERRLIYQLPVDPPLSIVGRPYTLDKPFPEWNMRDIWSTANLGMEPRLFNGLDIDLDGGAQIVLDGYFFHRINWNIRDSSDPVGKLYVEFEGWSGFGNRYGQEQLPALRHYDLPHYVRSIDLFPSNIGPASHPEFAGVQRAEYSWTDTLQPWLNPVDYPVAPPKSETYVTMVVPKPEARRTLMRGVYYSFYKDGCRYTLAVRGSDNLLKRYEGGLDALAAAVFDSVRVEAIDPMEVPEFPDHEQTMTRLITKMVSYDRKPDVLDVVTHQDLDEVRNLLLKFQRHSEPLTDEPELRRLYFKIRDKTQSGLLVSLGRAYDGRRATQSVTGERELMRIRQFFGDYPPLTMTRVQPGYPEWSMFFEEVTKLPPYNSLESARRRSDLERSQ